MNFSANVLMRLPASVLRNPVLYFNVYQSIVIQNFVSTELRG